MLTTAKVLDEAADYVLEHGMTRHKFTDCEDGGVCAVGAIQAVISTHIGEVLISGVIPGVVRREAIDVLAQEVPDHTVASDDPFSVVTVWNDFHCRDKEELALALRAAGKRAEADGC